MFLCRQPRPNCEIRTPLVGTRRRERRKPRHVATWRFELEVRRRLAPERLTVKLALAMM